jgi:hypothetical protein
MKMTVTPAAIRRTITIATNQSIFFSNLGSNIPSPAANGG